MFIEMNLEGKYILIDKNDIQKIMKFLTSKGYVRIDKYTKYESYPQRICLYIKKTGKFDWIRGCYEDVAVNWGYEKGQDIIKLMIREAKLKRILKTKSKGLMK